MHNNNNINNTSDYRNNKNDDKDLVSSTFAINLLNSQYIKRYLCS